MVVAYRTGSGKSKGLHTVYQQQVRYMQLHNLKGSPQQLFDKDLLHQCKLWHKSGERVILLMDANEHVLKGKFNKVLTRNGLDMEEFTNSSIPIDCGYKSSEIEVLNLFWIAQAITKHLS